jgi:hypothetical protein
MYCEIDIAPTKSYFFPLSGIWMEKIDQNYKNRYASVHVASLVNFNLTPQSLPYVNYWGTSNECYSR